MSKQQDIRVLIAEDDYLISEMIMGLLEKIGYTVIGKAWDGLEAVEMTQTLRPDVVLMDIKMPNMDGIEATRLVNERCPTPVVMLTAYETVELATKASAAGAGAYLVKPPNAPEIQRAITIATARFHDMMELCQLNTELQTRNEELDAFAHTVAHDLKNPLARIIGFAEILELDYATMSGKELGRYLHTIARSGHKMNNIIDELLVLAKVRKTEVILEPLEMASIVAQALQRLDFMLEEHQAEVVLPDTWPAALGYAPWVEEVWVNYLSNGIKYGGQPPRVELGATVQAANDVCFWIRDNGDGIPLEEQARLFIPFTRLDQTRPKGYGLGLSIVRRIVEKLGGQVGIQSKVGRGSVFTFTLPSCSQPDQAKSTPTDFPVPGE